MSAVGTCHRCRATFTGRASHCPVCHRTFSADTIADVHRVGGFEDGTRRCRSGDEEMRRLGAVERPYRNGTAWGWPPMPLDVLVARRGAPNNPGPIPEEVPPEPPDAPRAVQRPEGPDDAA